MYTIEKAGKVWRILDENGLPVRRKDLTIIESTSAAWLYSFCVYFGIVPVKVKG